MKMIDLYRKPESLDCEALEPRVLFSGAPVEPAEAEAADTQAPAQDAAESTEATSAEAPAEASVSGEAAATLVNTGSATLNEETLAAIAEAAKQRWIDSGISAEQLDALNSVTYQISDLNSNALGKAEGFTITIDDNAAGQGWFIDATPDLDEEFSLTGGRLLGISSGADTGIDLLTLVMHEQGHILGLADSVSGTTNVMSGILNVAERRAAAEGQALGLTPATLSGENFALTTAAIVGNTLSIVGDAATDNLVLRINAGNFEYDLNSGGFIIIGAVAGVNTIDIDMGGGSDSVTLQAMTVNADLIVSTTSLTIAGAVDISGATTPSAEITADRLLISAALNTGATGSVTFVPLTGGNVKDFHLGSAGDAFDNAIRLSNAEIANITAGSIVIGDTNTRQVDVLGDITLVANTEFVTWSSGLVNLNRRINGAFDLEITSGGTTVARPPGLGGIGTITPLDTIVTDAGGSTRLQDDAVIITTGDQTYNDFVRVGDSTNSVGQANLTANSVNFSATTTFRVDIDGDAGVGVAGGHDQLVVNGDVDLGGATLEVDFGSFVPVVGQTYVIIDNTGPNAVTGTFDGLPEGTVSSSPFGSTAMLYSISYIGGDGNDVEITLLGEPETLITQNSITDMITVEDINGGITNDELSVYVDGTDLVIEDANETVSSNIVGAVQDGANRIRIPLALVTGGLTINTLAGDDTVNIGNIATLSGGNLIVNGGADEDRINQTGDVVMSGSRSVTYTAEAIKLSVGASITTATGGITLTGSGATSLVGNVPGVWLQGASLSSTSGNILLTGQGGDTDHYNDGVRLNRADTPLTDSSITTGGTITLNGTAGAGISSSGVHIAHATISATGGSGSTLTINGTGSDDGNNGNGVYLFGATLSTSNGAATLRGTGGSTNSYNYGVVFFSGSSVATGGSGALTIEGTGGGSIGLSPGVALINGSSATVVNGAMNIRGTGGNGTGNQNRGVALHSLVNVSASGTGTITINGTGRGSGSDNGGVLLDGATVSSTNALTISGTGSTTGTHYSEGIDAINSSSISTGTGLLTLTGTANGSGRYNRGINLNKSTVQSTSGDIAITGVGSASSTLNYNQGIFSQGSSITTGGKITLSGTGGAGTSNNHGIHLHSTTAASTGALKITGRALAGTTGTLNCGVYLTNLASLTGAGGGLSTVTGTGGGGTGKNHGILMNKDVSVSGLVTGNFVGTAGAGTGSLARAGTHPFFN
ncbi:MAG: LEPR-XLL domain-containing protein [Verrucomicrobiales bacterium]|nr:LEPR-XLL domain-containing protein [Verrucomicrobiales bacterium]